MASRDAKLEGALSIFYNKNNIITEGSIRNIFLLKKILFTHHVLSWNFKWYYTSKIIELDNQIIK